jgi:predicted transcriptional regulator
VLFHAAAYHHGSYGYPQTITVKGETLDTIKGSLAADRVLKIRLSVEPTAQHRGGLAVYGTTMGRYPINPTLVLRTSGNR